MLSIMMMKTNSGLRVWAAKAACGVGLAIFEWGLRRLRVIDAADTLYGDALTRVGLRYGVYRELDGDYRFKIKQKLETWDGIEQ